MNTCKTCIHWRSHLMFKGESFKDVGICLNAGLKILKEGNPMNTGADFGCIQHESINPILTPPPVEN